MDGVVSSVRGGDQVLRIEHPLLASFEIFWQHGIHVVNQQPAVNIVAWNPKITSAVPEHDLITDILPFPRAVEVLVDPPIEAKGGLAYLSS
jgi:hypothetical protein